MRVFFTAIVSMALLLMAGCDKDEDEQKPKKEPPAPAAKKAGAKAAGGGAFKPGEWVDLFDGKTLKGWKKSGFDKNTKPKIEDGFLKIPMGEPLCGVTSTRKDLPRMGYEIELEVEKVDGDDFFCALTFPVGKSHASLVLGGWGGTVCGISCIDFMDAANNQTTQVVEFKENEWYHVKVRVLPDRLQAWLDSEELVNVSTVDRKIDIRIDIEESCPLGVATFQTVANYKYIRVRKLPKDFVLPESEKKDSL